MFFGVSELLLHIISIQAERHHLKFYPIVEDIDGLETSMLGLHFVIKTRHFRKGDLKFKCTATLAALYWQSNEASAEPDRPVHHQRSSSSEVYLDSHRTSTLASAALTVHFLGLFGRYQKWNLKKKLSCINYSFARMFYLGPLQRSALSACFLIVMLIYAVSLS